MRSIELYSVELAHFERLGDVLSVDLLESTFCIVGVEVNLPASLVAHWIELNALYLATGIGFHFGSAKADSVFECDVVNRNAEATNIAVSQVEVLLGDEVRFRMLPANHCIVIAYLT